MPSSYAVQPSKKKTRRRKKFNPKMINDGFRNPEDAAASIQAIWTRGRTRMYPLMRKWLTQLLYFRGSQNFDFVSGRDTDYLYEDDPQSLPDEVAFQTNLYQGHIMSRLAKMTRFDPRIRVAPTTPDDDDKSRAELWNDVLAWRQRRQHFTMKMQRLFMYLELFGNAFLKSSYDPDAGAFNDPLENMGKKDLDMYASWSRGELPPDEVKERTEIGGRGVLRYLEGERTLEDFGRRGEVLAEVIPPYEITIADRYPREDLDLSGILHSRIIRLQEIRERYHDHPQLDQIKPGMDNVGHQLWFLQQAIEESETSFMGGGDYDDDSRSAHDYPEEGEGIEYVDPFDGIMVHEWWAKPCPTRKRGMRVVSCGNVILEPSAKNWDDEIGNPYLHGELPLVHVVNTLDGVNFWATCPAEQAIDVQSQINETITQIIEVRNRTANPVLIAERGHGIDFDNVIMDAGELLEPTRGKEIHYLETPSMAPYVDRLLGVLVQQLEMIFSDHKPSQGQSNAGDSGKKVRFLQQADEARFAPYAKNLSTSLRRFWIQQAMLTAQYTDRKTIGYVIGNSQERSFFEFDREALLGRYGPQPELQAFPNLDATRARIMALRESFDLEVHVIPGKSQQTVREELGVLMETGFLQPNKPNDQQIVLERLGWGLEVPKILAERRRQMAMASLENDGYVAGKFVNPPHMYQDHEAHMEVHVRFIDSERYNNMDEVPEEMFLAHLEAHEKLLAFREMRQQYALQDAMAESNAMLGPNLMADNAVPDGQQQAKGPQGNPGQGTGGNGAARKPAKGVSRQSQPQRA